MQAGIMPAFLIYPYKRTNENNVCYKKLYGGETKLGKENMMIVQHRIVLETKTEPTSSAIAYPLYAWLLSHVSKEKGDALHEQGLRPISQYVYREGKYIRWIVNLLNDEAVELFGPILEHEKAALVHQGVIPFGEHGIEIIESAQKLFSFAGNMRNGNRFSLDMVTPTAFKQSGRYAIFPQESLILQSLIARWKLCFPEFPMDDPEALQAILTGLHIVDYRLHTVRYTMKQTKIPSFMGRVTLEAHLPVPLMEIVKTLYVFAPYAGMGIKTALGMGGIQLCDIPKESAGERDEHRERYFL